MGQFERHVFVCTSGKTCPRQGATDLSDVFREQVKALDLTDRIRVNKSGCMAQCGWGPMVVVYPEDTWYAAVRPSDVPQIIEEHLVGGRPVERLLFRPPGAGKQICPREEWSILPEGDA